MSSNVAASSFPVFWSGSVRTCGSQQSKLEEDADVADAAPSSDAADPVVTDEEVDAADDPAAEGGVLHTTESNEGAPDVVVVVSLEPKASKVHTDWNWNMKYFWLKYETNSTELYRVSAQFCRTFCTIHMAQNGHERQ